MGDEEASAEQKINIGTYFVMSAPVGEVDDVNADVSKLIGDSSIWSDEVQQKVFRDYNLELMTTAADPSGNPMLVSTFGQVSDRSYIDPNSGDVLEFDHRKRAFTKVLEKRQKLAGEIGAYRDAIQKAVNKYVEDHYKKDKCVGIVYGTESGNITVCLSARNTNLGNYWTGGWRSVFSVNVKSKGDAEMKAAAKVLVHYFEDGNVQLHTALDKTFKVKIADPDATAKEVAGAISALESSYQSNLEEMYVEMHRTTFKSMRRFLPITGQPMNWNINAHSIAQDLKQ